VTLQRVRFDMYVVPTTLGGVERFMDTDPLSDRPGKLHMVRFDMCFVPATLGGVE
jgi:hypothetical protein